MNKDYVPLELPTTFVEYAFLLRYIQVASD